MLQELVKLANHLDSKGLVKEADYLDKIIKLSQDTYPDARTEDDPELERLTEFELQQGDKVFDVGNVLWYAKYRDQHEPNLAAPARVIFVADATPETGHYQVETVDENGVAKTEIAYAWDLNQMREYYKAEAIRKIDEAHSAGAKAKPGPGAFSGIPSPIDLAKRIANKDKELVKNIGQYDDVLDLNHEDFKGMFPNRESAWQFARTFEGVTKYFRWGTKSPNIFKVEWA